MTGLVRPVSPSTMTLTPLAVRDVVLDGGFWGDRQRLNRDAIMPHSVEWVTRLGWLGNLEAARSAVPYEHRGREFADSEVYKLIEALSWESARDGTPSELEAALERFIEAVVSAQDPDGYLHTLFGRPWQRPRWSDFQWGHELYCFGHLIQAAVANHRATGDERLLAVARRVGDHVVTMFAPGALERVCGHAEIEVALVELYRETGDRRYLDQASVFVERRGTGTLPLFEFGRAYWQDDMPVRAAEVLRGHAVRALYLAAGAVDVAVETGDAELLAALETQWTNTVARRTYLTGGMGSHHMDEAFGDDFVLPPDRSYCETCAGVASIMFSWRLLLATGEARYADLIERTLYNVVATSPADDGRSFFYANTLHQRTTGAPAPLNDDGVCIRGGSSGREAWFEVSCCPPNVARTLASLSAYVATGSAARAEKPTTIQIHQYAPGRIEVDGAVLEVTTDYPRDGRVSVRVLTPPRDGGVAEIALRVPSWAEGALVTVGGAEASPVSPGTWSVERPWSVGDEIVLVLPMTPRVTWPDGRVDAVRGTVAVERGPLVHALESVDLPQGWAIDGVNVDASVPPELDDDGRVLVAVRRSARAVGAAWPFGSARPGSSDDGASVDDRPDAREADSASVPLVAYHEWANRGPSTMRVWLPVA